jgi:hypothetical protein
MSTSITLPNIDLSQQLDQPNHETPDKFTCFGNANEIKNYDELKKTCEVSVENIRQIIINLGETLQCQSYSLTRLRDVYATPQRVIQNNINELSQVQEQISQHLQDGKKKDSNLFCGTYFTVKDVKDWGYRGLDYISAAVALGLIVIGTIDNTDSDANGRSAEKEVVTKASLTAILLVFSKVLSAVTDYRNKKKYENEVKLSMLKDLSYKCQKAKEATAILQIMQSITTAKEPSHSVLLRKICEEKLGGLQDENGGIFDFSTAKSLKRQLIQEIDKTIERQIIKNFPSISHTKDDFTIIVKAFRSWKLFLKIDDGSKSTTPTETQEKFPLKTSQQILSLNLPPLDYQSAGLIPPESASENPINTKVMNSTELESDIGAM